jgi:hypothetical protein
MATELNQQTGSSGLVICSLTPEALKAGRAMLLPGLGERAEHVVMTEDGCRLTFGASHDALMAITRAIDAERECCRWLRFDLTVMPDGGPFVLTLSGPAGARDFLAALFDSSEQTE